jgi:hypothetical protein
VPSGSSTLSGATADRLRRVEPREDLAAAEAVTVSVLTLIECDRALIRGLATGAITEPETLEARRLLNRAAHGWSVMGIDGEVVERARRPFPAEPLRALDAIHLASALIVARDVPGLVILSLDQRIRLAARQLGLDLAPA